MRLLARGTSVDADWEKKPAASANRSTWMLGDEPPMMPPAPVAVAQVVEARPRMQRRGGPRRLPGAARAAAPIPARSRPIWSNWVIQRGGNSFGWLEPQKSQTTSRSLSFGFNVRGDLYYPAEHSATAPSCRP